MCTGLDLVARVVRARLTHAKRLVSGDLVGACLDVCVRVVSACGVRGCGVGARREPGELHGCVEAVHVAAGRRRTLVGSRLKRRRQMWALYGRARGRLGDTVSSCSAGSKYAWLLGLVRHPVALSGLLLRWQSRAFGCCCVGERYAAEMFLTLRTIRVVGS
jgi:hypothetical protein